MKIFLVFTFLIAAHADCPPGFTLLDPPGSCYKVVYENLDWEAAGQKCQGMGEGYHSAHVTDEAESKALTTFLSSELDKYNDTLGKACLPADWSHLGHMFWTSGQRQEDYNCKSDFVWKPKSGVQIPFGFTNWLAGEPNCEKNYEFCVHIWAERGYTWNDIPCNKTFCALCEFKP